MSTNQGVKVYLERYLRKSNGDKEEKKRRKKKKKMTSLPGLRIIDDDMDPQDTLELSAGDTELYDLAENAPQVVGIVDERPPVMQELEKFQNTNKWRIITDENDLAKVETIKSNAGMTNYDSDLSPERAANTQDDESDQSPPRMNKRRNYNDQSSLRIERGESRKREIVEQYPEYASTSKKHFHYDANRSSSRNSELSFRRESESKTDHSPRRFNQGSHQSRRSHYYDVATSSRKSHKWESGNQIDFSSQRTRKRSNNSDYDMSPPRHSEQFYRNKSHHDSDHSFQRNTERTYHNKKSNDCDLSPPRAKFELHHSRKSHDLEHLSPRHTYRSRKEQGNDPRISPSRRTKDYHRSRGSHEDSYLHSSTRGSRLNRRSQNPDISPPEYGKIPSRKESANDSDSDLSPPRHGKYSRRDEQSDMSRKMGNQSQRKFKNKCNENVLVKLPKSRWDDESSRSTPIEDPKQNLSDSDLSPPRSTAGSNKRKQTLDGKQAGLQDAKTLKAETERLKAIEHAHFEQMSAAVSGRGARTIVRDRKTGKKRDLAKEQYEQEKKEEADQERLAKFKKLAGGLVQAEEKSQRLRDHMHEMSKPLARYADDADLEEMLRAQEREGDPMLEYIREKKQKSNPGAMKPKYQGPTPPNRFNIRPGHKWDGVDRSTGFEKKLFDQKNAKKALEEEAYKWSVSDM